MSNNSQDEPNEYEIIFDGTTSNSSADTKIEVSDAEPETTLQSDEPAEYIDAEVDSDINDADGFMKNHQSDAEDGDIEEGIFAPVRKPKKAGKKTASLMWAVSLLAFVGVGAFVYVTKPDIVSKVTSNLGSGGDVTLPSDATTADSGTVVPDATADVTAATEPVSEIDPSLHASDTTDAIKPDVAAQDTPTTEVPAATPDTAVTNLATVPTEVPVAVATPTIPVAPTADAVSPVAAVAPAPDLLSVDPKPAVEEAKAVDTTAPVPNETAAAKGPTASDATTASTPVPVNPSSDTPVVVATSETKDVSSTPSAPKEEGLAPATPPVSVATSSDVITPTNDREDFGDEGINDAPLATTATAPAVAPSVAPPVAEVKKAEVATAKKEEPAAKENKPVIVASKEEKKVLDDANLDKYFDSPSGKMLKDIPAPSMDPKKGSRESIIIVNKNGKKASADYTKPAGPIAIETTSLSAQMVSANRAMKLGRYDAAKEMYDDLYKLNPRDVQILSGRAVLMQKMGFNDQAISAYEELLKIDPDNTDAIVNLSGLIRKQYPAVALSKLLDLHMNHPDNVAVTAQLGVAYADSGNFPDAMRYLGDAAAMDPKNPQHFYNMAVISEKAKKPDQAISYYEKALEVDSIYGEGQKTVSKEKIYDRLAQLRGN